MSSAGFEGLEGYFIANSYVDELCVCVYIERAMTYPPIPPNPARFGGWKTARAWRLGTILANSTYHVVSTRQRGRGAARQREIGSGLLPPHRLVKHRVTGETMAEVKQKV